MAKSSYAGTKIIIKDCNSMSRKTKMLATLIRSVWKKILNPSSKLGLLRHQNLTSLHVDKERKRLLRYWWWWWWWWQFSVGCRDSCIVSCHVRPLGLYKFSHSEIRIHHVLALVSLRSLFFFFSFSLSIKNWLKKIKDIWKLFSTVSVFYQF